MQHLDNKWFWWDVETVAQLIVFQLSIDNLD